MSRLSQKVIIITGSSSGLGRAIALSCAREGCKLVVCADLIPFPTRVTAQNTSIEKDSTDTKIDLSLYDDDKLKKGNMEYTHDLICAEYGEAKAVFVKCDVTVEEEVENVVKVAVEKGGRLDVIINNAGTGSDGCLMHDLPSERFEQIMKLNTQGPFNGCKYALAQFLKQNIDNHGHRGHIVNISSAAGLAGVRYAVFNSAMTQHLFSNDIATSYMKSVTPYWKNEGGNIEDIAKAALFLASEDAAWITGTALAVDGGFSA